MPTKHSLNNSTLTLTMMHILNIFTNKKSRHYVIQKRSNISLSKLKKYIKENWGSPFIITFIILLMNVATLLTVGSLAIANTVATYAFYTLICGVVLQFISFSKSKKPLKSRLLNESN
jgi:hypothetical protein